MNWFVPREHGAWAMLVVPYLVGMLASNITWLHLPFFIGVMAFYFASGPFLTSVRKPKLRKVAMPAFTIYMCIGSLFTLPILYLIPEIIFIGLLIIPFFIVNIIFAKLKKERLFINDLCAILALSFLVLISYYIGSNVIETKTLIVMAINVIFFTASVFHVKSLIREHGNRVFLLQSIVFHFGTVVGFLVIAMPAIALIFFINSLKNWLMLKRQNYKPMHIGLIEIASSILFVIVIGISF